MGVKEGKMNLTRVGSGAVPFMISPFFILERDVGV